VTIANRDESKARTLAREVGAGVGSAEEARETDYDIVVNATSVGMALEAGGSPLPEAALRPGLVVMDIVYHPIETELIRAARRRGAIAIHGGRMLLYQAARQFELYTGVDAPLAAMEAALLAEISAK
jgi:shikimate dehydrogenase